MKTNIIAQINSMRCESMSSAEIATRLGMSRNTVKSHIRRHSQIPGIQTCVQCGKVYTQPEGRKQKRFCSDKCRITYWNHCYRNGGSHNG